jgi:hypothetical protein
MLLRVGSVKSIGSDVLKRTSLIVLRLRVFADQSALQSFAIALLKATVAGGGVEREEEERPETVRIVSSLSPRLPQSQFSFKGVSKYVEDFVAQIDTPQLDRLSITFFNQLVFDTPRLSQFISRIPKFQSPDEARIVFHDSVATY